MTISPRTPSHPPTPASKEPRGRRAQKLGAPGDSFYGSMLSDSMKEALQEAGVIEGLDQEIAFLRFRLRGLLGDIAKNQRHIFKVIELIIRAYAAKIRAPGESDDPDDDAIIEMLREATDTLGLKRVPWSQTHD